MVPEHSSADARSPFIQTVGFRFSSGKKLALLAIFLIGQTFGQAASPVESTRVSCAEMDPGVVVESVGKNSEAEKALLAEGDVILAWSRGDVKGVIQSPFDLLEVETEQEPRGQVTLSGTRGGTEHKWTMGPGKWDLGTRPQLTEEILSVYREGQGFAEENKLTQALQRWRSAADESKASGCVWLSSWILFHAAERAASSREWKESDALYRDALDLAPEGASLIRATLQRKWAATFQPRGEWAQAQKYEEHALEESRKVGSESLTIATSLNDLGRIFYYGRDIKSSERYYQQALAIRQKLAPASLDVARSLTSLADVAHEQGDLAKAVNYDLQALAIEQALVPDGLEVAGTKNSLGYIESDRGDLVSAEKWQGAALDIRRKLLPDSLEVADSLNNLGIDAARQGNLDRADEYWHQSLLIKQKLVPDSLNVAWTLGNLGVLNLQRGDLDKAQDYLQQDLVIEEKNNPNSLDTAKSLNNLGRLAEDRGDLAKAEQYDRQALSIKQSVGPDSVDVASSTLNLGQVAYKRGDLVRAEDYYRQALAIWEKLAPGSADEASTLNDLGECASDRGELDRAEDYYRRAIVLLEKVAPGSIDLAAVEGNLGSVASARGDNGNAEARYRQAIEIVQKDAPESIEMAGILDNLMKVSLATGDQEKAEQYVRHELAIRGKLAPESDGYAEALAGLARIVEAKQQTEEALHLYGQAIDVFDRQLNRLGGSAETRATFRARQADVYSDYADLLAEQKKPDLAFDVLERSRARTLLEMLAGANVDIRQGADPALIEKERLLQANLTVKTNRKIDMLEGEHTPEQITTLTREIDQTLSEYQELEGQILTNSPKYAALTQPKPLTASEVQQLLNAQTVLVAYALGAKRSFAFVVTATSLDSYELPKRDDIETTARRAYDLLTARNRRIAGETTAQRQARLASDDAEGRKVFLSLSQIVLGPFIQRLADKRLLIVADGALQYIPFGALPVPESDASKAPVLLVSEHEIVNLPSASVLALLRQQSRERKAEPMREVAILADPVFEKSDPRVGNALRPPLAAGKDGVSDPISQSTDQLTRSIQDVNSGSQQSGTGLPRLAFSRREAAAIMAIAKPGTGMDALDFQANRETALSNELSQYRIVHFATHGLLDNEHPELSGLVFSLVDQNGNPRDGFVDLQDVYNLTLSADLVVLSACETGLGKEIGGEGLVGLTRGFMYAGAGRVVASLWDVDDVATSELMAAFYKGMLHDSLAPAAALRHAQLVMLKRRRWADPYYWAAFTIQGEWK